MNLVCPGCRTTLAIPDDAGGKQLRCPNCQTVFLAPPPALAVVTPPNPPAEPTPVPASATPNLPAPNPVQSNLPAPAAASAAMLQLQCAGCRQAQSVPASAAGQQVCCPYCRTVFVATGPVVFPADPMRVAAGAPSLQLADAAGWRGLAAGGPGLFLLAGLIFMLTAAVDYVAVWFLADTLRIGAKTRDDVSMELLGFWFQLLLVPLVFIFLGGGLLRAKRVYGLVITGLVFELLFSGFLLIRVIATLFFLGADQTAVAAYYVVRLVTSAIAGLIGTVIGVRLFVLIAKPEARAEFAKAGLGG